MTVYSSDANGNATPTATISGSNTGITAPTGIAVDAAGKIYVTNAGSTAGFVANPGTVVVFAAAATGNATPIATISGPDAGLPFISSIAVDASGNIFVWGYTSNPASSFVANIEAIYASGSSGNVPPVSRDVQGTVFLASGIAVDASGKAYLSRTGGQPPGANFFPSAVSIYPPATTDLEHPIAVLNNTGVGGIAVDAAGKIYTAAPGLQAGAVTIYAPDSTGNAPPIATIQGSLQA